MPKAPKPQSAKPQPKTASNAPRSPFQASAAKSASARPGPPKSSASQPAPSRAAQPQPAPAKAAKKQPFPAPKAPKPGIPTALISRRASDSIRRGHLWVYASDIEELHAPKENPPALIAVADNRGIPLGTALFSPNSQIALRLVSRELITEVQWHEILAHRLREAIARRAPLLNEDNNAARLVFSEADNLPGIVADKYAEIVILQLLAKGLDTARTREICAEIIASAIPGETLTIWERPDPRIRQLEGLSAPSTTPLYHRAAAGSEPQSSTLFRINGLSFHFDALSGQKTGAFLDQRQNYAAAARWARARNVQKALDICTYQGGFALHLTQAGCEVTAVDQSRSSLEVAEHNLDLNRRQGHLPPAAEIDWLEADAFDLLRDWASQTRLKPAVTTPGFPETSLTGTESSTHPTQPWQMIVLDPPAFAKSKRAVEGALRGYKELNLRALQLLAPGGLLVTCSCSHHVSLADLESAVASAAADAGRRVTLLERRGAALDHPTVLNLPETEYLKCLILSVD